MQFLPTGKSILIALPSSFYNSKVHHVQHASRTKTSTRKKIARKTNNNRRSSYLHNTNIEKYLPPIIVRVSFFSFFITRTSFSNTHNSYTAYEKKIDIWQYIILDQLPSKTKTKYNNNCFSSFHNRVDFSTTGNTPIKSTTEIGEPPLHI